MLGETYWTLMRDPAHWMFELTLEAVTFGLGAAWAWVRVKRHIHRDVTEAITSVEAHLHDDIRAYDQVGNAHHKNTRKAGGHELFWNRKTNEGRCRRDGELWPCAAYRRMSSGMAIDGDIMDELHQG